MFCPKCGNQLEDNAIFCTACGAKMEDFQTTAEATPEEAPAQETPVVEDTP
ncbi:MAG: zinc ribbon domain-containing protein, partial [Clostridia bacterium]|nr:zinc ribbon domain-containing protein [Clostridia bacterium]